VHDAKARPEPEKPSFLGARAAAWTDASDATREKVKSSVVIVAFSR
jgi:hypothetical protein